MFNFVQIAQAITEKEHLAHHANDKIADASNNISNMMGGNMSYMMTGNWGWLMMIFGWVIGILVLVLLILLIIWLVKQIQK
jgi:tetrahydromethanopterin S-methyltransferase subunit B